MTKFWALFKHDIRDLIFSPGTLCIFLIFPTVLISLMGFLFNTLYNTSLVSSYDFYGVTMIFFIAMMGSTIPANAFLGKRLKSGNTRIFYSPVSKIYIYSSKILACFLFIAISLSINIILFEMIGFVNFGGNNISYVVLLLVVSVLFLTILSSAICVSLHSEELTNIILSNTMSTLGLFSGIFFPIASLGTVFENIASFSPIKWTVDCAFELIYDGNANNYWWILFGLVMLSLVMLYIVHRNYRPEDYI